MQQRIRGSLLTVCVGLLLLAACKPTAPLDLSGSLRCLSDASPGEELGDRIAVTLKNTDGGLSEDAEDFFVDLVLSSDEIIPAQLATYSPNFTDDVLLQGGREYVDRLGPGASLDLPLYGKNTIPADTPPGDYYLGAVIDPEQTVAERNEDNNVLLCPVKVCAEAADIINGVITGASGGTVGFAQLNLAWTYETTGEKPNRLTITVYRLQGGSWDNIMPSQQPFDVASPATTTEAKVVIFRLFAASYRLVFDATYSCDRHRQFVYELEFG